MIDNTKFNKDVEQQEVLHTSLGSVSWNNHLKKLFGSIHQSWTHGKIHEPYHLINIIYHMEMSHVYQKTRNTNAHSSIILSWPPNRNNLHVHQQ